MDYIYPEFRNLNDRAVFLRVPKKFWSYPFEKTKGQVVQIMKRKGFLAAGIAQDPDGPVFDAIDSLGNVDEGILDTI